MQGEDLDQWWEPMRAIEERAAQEGGSMWLDFVGLAQNTVSAYMRQMDGQNIEVIGVEDNLQMEVSFGGHTWPLTRSADLIIKVGDAYRIVDHKFVGRLTGRTISRYGLSGQFLDYALSGQGEVGRPVRRGVD